MSKKVLEEVEKKKKTTGTNVSFEEWHFIDRKLDIRDLQTKENGMLFYLKIRILILKMYKEECMMHSMF